MTFSAVAGFFTDRTMIVYPKNVGLVLFFCLFANRIEASEQKSELVASPCLKQTITALASDFKLNLLPTSEDLLKTRVSTVILKNNSAEEGTIELYLFMKNEIVGQVIFTCAKIDAYTTSVHLDLVIIKKDYQSRGIGTFFINKIIDFCRKIALNKKMNILFSLESAYVSTCPAWAEKSNITSAEQRAKFYTKLGLKRVDSLEKLDLAINSPHSILTIFSIIFAGAPDKKIPKILQYCKVIDVTTKIPSIHQNSTLEPLFARIGTYFSTIFSTNDSPEKIFPRLSVIYDFTDNYKNTLVSTIAPLIGIKNGEEQYVMSFGKFKKSKNLWKKKTGSSCIDPDCNSPLFKKSQKLFDNIVSHINEISEKPKGIYQK